MSDKKFDWNVFLKDYDMLLKNYAEKQAIFLKKANHVFAIKCRSDLFPICENEEMQAFLAGGHCVWLDIDKEVIKIKTEEFFGGGSECYYYDFPMKLMSLGDDEIIEYFQELKRMKDEVGVK